MIDVTDILMHWHAGRSKNEMAESLGVDRKTLRKYIAPAEAAGITAGGCPVTGISARYDAVDLGGLFKWQRVQPAHVIEVGPPQYSPYDLPVDAARRLPGWTYR